MNSNNIYRYWEGQKFYQNQNSILFLKKNKSEKVIEKRVFITQKNKKYTEMQPNIMKQIDSPYVVKYLMHDVNPQQRSLYIYMKYYPKGDLEEFLMKNQFLSFKKRLRMFIDILMGLMELHSRFIIHRDLKLKNIFVDEDERCVVGDLGIAQITEKNAASDIGTVGNQAPQVYKAQNYDQKVDIWTLGIIAYQIFNQVTNGVIPYPFQQPQKHNLREIGGRVNYKNYVKFTSKVKPLDNDIPEKLKDLILKMLKVNPLQRIGWIQLYQSAVLLRFFENDQEVQSERLIPFKAEYQRIAYNRAIINQYIEYIEKFREIYFYKLQNMLKKQKIAQLQTDPKYQKFRENIHDLHIFFYLLMRKTLSKYEYIKQKRIYRAIIDLKDFITKVKEAQYIMQIRINHWLSDKNEKPIAKNSKYLNNDYFNGLQQKFDKMLEEIQ